MSESTTDKPDREEGRVSNGSSAPPPDSESSAPASHQNAEGGGQSEFARQAAGQQPGLIAEFWDFLKHNKAWWLTPIIVVLLLLGVLLFLTSGSAVAPFIYPLF